MGRMNVGMSCQNVIERGDVNKMAAEHKSEYDRAVERFMSMTRCQQEWFDNKIIRNWHNDSFEYRCQKANAFICLENLGEIDDEVINKVFDTMERYCSTCDQKMLRAMQ